ncbi:unnamed protein product [Zymoseptoria tritici ST99CH_1A5]|uniref:G protein-coupled receptor GPR1/2/3 C-terminal domain-containing protein n=3 Tax=Zymoseptoria tritici TaxID=1047171 RepID=A0A2H1H8Q5_ZYMTR|nr:unnamed protein product [Zymoseptoria tritici ST99CH_1E4]SMY30014.1 unnamed protein product [Zymoseptoria tritici ST99CH_1A5]
MPDPYSPLIHLDGHDYFPPPYSLPELSSSLRIGLIPIAIFATLSVASTSALIIFITLRIVTWRRYCNKVIGIGYNQYIVLVLNLLIADLQQGASFLISWHWYRKGHILAPSPACFAQGWLLQSGDVSSGFFVLAIALHTYYTAALGMRISSKVFAGLIAGVWVLTLFLTFIGIALHRETYFVRAGAWCWVSSAYEHERLWCHYVWVFAIEFGTILIYLTTFYALRKKTQSVTVNGELPPNSSNARTVKALNRITMNMVLYPFAYVLLTLPLSAGRMWSMSRNGQNPSDLFLVIAGSLMTSCGWVDSLLYTLTREKLLSDTMPKMPPLSAKASTDWNQNHSGSHGITHTRTITMQSVTADSCDDLCMDDFTNAHHERKPSWDNCVDPILLERPMRGDFNLRVVTEITGGPERISDEFDGSRMRSSSPPPVFRRPGSNVF